MAGDDDAPWLAEADGPVPQRSLTVRIIIGLAAFAVVAIIIVFILLRPGGSSDQGYMEADQAPLITAEPGPYKVKPQDPRGLDVEGLGDTMYAAGAGIEQSNDINFGAPPEEPLPRPGTVMADTDTVEQPAPQSVPPPASPKNLLPPAMQQPVEKPAAEAPKPAPVAPPKAAPKPAPAATAAATQVQLGAFSSRARAEAAWSRLVAKYGLPGLTPRYISTTSGDQTLFRLRTTPPDAAALCARLAAAGDPCTEVKP